MPWTKAGPGRPPGAKNKITLQQREAAEMVLGKFGSPEFAEFAASQRKLLMMGLLAPGIVQMWMSYLVGKPKETIDLVGEDGESVVTKVIRVIVDSKANAEEYAAQEAAAEGSPADSVH